MRELAAAKADVNRATPLGRTPMFAASTSGCAECARELASAKAGVGAVL